ncbi:hypothetical protein T10_11380 [Trichinella papuae]|uniref:Uncharacterized protein n=1 Tax=Trichinella papuae TaxID=268474 RepID=A0A0V1M7D6_9BILA|nr:hypothetical protein T10_11380 [Trichinella papuae]
MSRLVDYRVANCRFGGLQCTTVERRLSTGGISVLSVKYSFACKQCAEIAFTLKTEEQLRGHQTYLDKSADNALLIHHRWPELEESRQLVAACLVEHSGDGLGSNKQQQTMFSYTALMPAQRSRLSLYLSTCVDDEFAI